MLRRIGGGSYGEVWLARSVTGALRAVKIVRREDFDLERTFEREFSGIQRYEKVSQGHPGLADVLHVGRNDKAGFYYYVMELADDAENGEDFEIADYVPRTLTADLAGRGPLPLADCVRTGRALASALGHLHRAGLTHRDVKPSNIIFVRGEPQMADIGLVARSGQRTYVGTEGYVPPEGPGTASADLFSLAMVLYEMHTGKDRLEFPELPTNLELPRTVNRDEWRALNNVICRAGSPDAKKRYESADAFAAALASVCEATKPLGIGAREANTGTRALAAGIVVLLVALGLGGWQLVQTFNPEGPAVDGDGDGGSGGGTNGTLADGGNEAGGGGTGGDVAAGDSDASASADVPETLAGIDSPLTVIGEATPSDGAAPVIQDAVSNPDSGGETSVGGSDSVDTAAGVVGSVGNGDGTAEPGPDPGSDTPPEPDPQLARIKVSSHPPGAAVFVGDTVRGYTPTGFLDMPPGETDLVVKLDGHHDEVIRRDLQPGGNPLVYVAMREDHRPVAGQEWQNTLGVVFRHEGGIPGPDGEGGDDGFHISAREVDAESVARFMDAAGRSGEPLAGFEGAAFLEEMDQWAFCDWMTDVDRRAGYLGEGEYYRPQPSLTQGMEKAFYCLIDRRFGSVEIASEPAQAVVMQHGKRIGRTPLTIERHRAGPVMITLDLPGYRTTAVDGTVRADRRLKLDATLERDDSLVFGEPWTNSLGMRFAPVGDLMASVFETRVQDYAAFQASPEGGEHAPKPPQVELLADQPIVGVGIENARAFCRWLTDLERASGRLENYHEYRLPTDLEWSAMAGLEGEDGATPEERDGHVPDVYPWGSEWPPPEGSGNFLDESAARVARQPILKGYDDGYERLAPVGRFAANRHGLHDLSGNVWEWVDEPYGGEGSPLATVRGGCFLISDRSLLLTSYRNAISATLRDDLYGFRCVLVEDRTLAEAAWRGAER